MKFYHLVSQITFQSNSQTKVYKIIHEQNPHIRNTNKNPIFKSQNPYITKVLINKVPWIPKIFGHKI